MKLALLDFAVMAMAETLAAMQLTAFVDSG